MYENIREIEIIILAITVPILGSFLCAFLWSDHKFSFDIWLFVWAAISASMGCIVVLYIFMFISISDINLFIIIIILDNVILFSLLFLFFILSFFKRYYRNNFNKEKTKYYLFKNNKIHFYNWSSKLIKILKVLSWFVFAIGCWAIFMLTINIKEFNVWIFIIKLLSPFLIILARVFVKIINSVIPLIFLNAIYNKKNKGLNKFKKNIKEITKIYNSIFLFKISKQRIDRLNKKNEKYRKKKKFINIVNKIEKKVKEIKDIKNKIKNANSKDDIKSFETSKRELNILKKEVTYLISKKKIMKITKKIAINIDRIAQIKFYLN